jgi:hypothetical protein
MADADILEIPTAATFRELLTYDPETGVLTWLWRERKWFSRDQDWRSWNTRYAGKPALAALGSRGYRNGELFHRKYRAHRVIWLYHYGEWPSGQIDHINHVRTDNSIANLRIVSNDENQRNCSHSKNNTSGATGVHWDKSSGKWRAEIRAESRKIYLGLFIAFDDAVAARKAAEMHHGFHQNHGIAAGG